MIKMLPFFTRFGAKWRIALKYPKPRHAVIIEPFAGAAGYATRHYDRQVILNDLDSKVFGTWDFLIRSTPVDIIRLPLQVEDVRDLKICQEAKWLIGWWINKGTESPRFQRTGWNKLSPNAFWVRSSVQGSPSRLGTSSTGRFIRNHSRPLRI